MPDKHSSWSRTENRAVLPFSVSQSFQQCVTFGLSPDKGALEDHSVQLSETDFATIKPWIGFSPDAAQLTSEYSQLSSGQLMVSGIVRYPSVRRVDRLGSWTISELPDVVDVKAIAPNVSEIESEVSVILWNTTGYVDDSGIGVRPYSTLGRSTLEIVRESEDSGFAVMFRDPDTFVRAGMPAQTPWTVWFNSTDFTEAAAGAVEVWVNSDLDGKIQQIVDQSRVGVITEKSMAADVLCDIAIHVLQNLSGGDSTMPESSDRKSLVQIIKQILGNDSLRELSDIAVEKPEVITARIRAHVSMVDAITHTRI